MPATFLERGRKGCRIFRVRESETAIYSTQRWQELSPRRLVETRERVRGA